MKITYSSIRTNEYACVCNVNVDGKMVGWLLKDTGTGLYSLEDKGHQSYPLVSIDGPKVLNQLKKVTVRPDGMDQRLWYKGELLPYRLVWYNGQYLLEKHTDGLVKGWFKVGRFFYDKQQCLDQVKNRAFL